MSEGRSRGGESNLRRSDGERGSRDLAVNSRAQLAQWRRRLTASLRSARRLAPRDRGDIVNVFRLSARTKPGNSSAKLFKTDLWRIYQALDLADAERSEGAPPVRPLRRRRRQLIVQAARHRRWRAQEWVWPATSAISTHSFAATTSRATRFCFWFQPRRFHHSRAQRADPGAQGLHRIQSSTRPSCSG